MPGVNLIRFLQQLNNAPVEIELKKGQVVSGQVSHVDGNMNVHMTEAKVVVKGKDPITVEKITVRGATVRHIVLPPDLKYDSMLAQAEAATTKRQGAPGGKAKRN